MNKRKLRLIVITALILLYNGYKVNAEPVQMAIDAPRNGIEVNEDIDVSGWAIDTSGLKQVQIFNSNGELIGQTTENFIRDDVQRVYNTFSTARNSGYSVKISLEKLNLGKNTLKIRATGNDGKFQERTVEVIKQDGITNIEAPRNGITADGDIKIVGWTLNPSGVKEVQILDQNGNLLGKAQRYVREDVRAAFRNYKDAANSGFEYVLQMANLKDGSNNIKIRTIGNDGSYKDNIITIKREESRTNIETPKSGITVNDDIKIGGWTLNPSGVKEVQILDQNGNLLGKAQRYVREDVKAAFRNYKDAANSGFEYVLQNSVLKAGNNSIQIRAIGNDGSYKDTTLNLKKEYDNLKPQMNLEILKDEDVFENQNIFVEGWAINESGLKNIQIFVDGTLKADTTPNISRTDVKNTYPNYPNSENSGFRVTIDKNSIGIGKHKVRIVAIGNNGSTQEKTMNVYVSKLSPIMNLETLSSGQVFGNSVNVSGWSLNQSGTKTVEILLDGRKIADVGTTGSRQDVYNAYTNYNQLNSGFSKTIDLSSMSSGRHTITVTCIGNDGDRVSRSVVVNNKRVENLDFNGKMNIESPQSDSNQKGVVRVAGWAIAPDGVSDVSIYVDGKYVVSAQYGLQRNDVFNAYSSYKNSVNSGFISDINLNNFALGDHEIMVIVRETNGAMYSKKVNIKRINEKRTIAIDIGHNANMDSGATGFFNENAVNMDIGKRVIEKLEKLGYNVIYCTPTTANSLRDSLQKRVDAANSNGAELYVSIHANAGGGNGTEVWVGSTNSIDIANKVLKNMTSLGYNNRGVKIQGVDGQHLYVLNNTNMPAILVETFFVDSQKDVNMYDPERIANAIVNALILY